MKKKSFKKLATEHQLKHYEGENQVPIKKKEGRAQDHWLKAESAGAGMIFYHGYGIFNVVKSFRKNKADTPEWFYDTLRSQHIPFNFFVPLSNEKQLCIDVLNKLFQLNIAEIQPIVFEFPPHGENPLNDHTSFDAFITYTTVDQANGFIGIEVKNTEVGYSFGENERNSIPGYYKKTSPELYRNADEPLLTENKFRQIWRNHLLASNYKPGKYQHFLSVTLFPEGNDHFVKAFEKYKDFLTPNGNKTLKGVTYEAFFIALTECCSTLEQKEWIKYLVKRYLVSNQEFNLNQLEEIGK
jgi:hypothetical protein